MAKVACAVWRSGDDAPAADPVPAPAPGDAFALGDGVGEGENDADGEADACGAASSDLRSASFFEDLLVVGDGEGATEPPGDPVGVGCGAVAYGPTASTWRKRSSAVWSRARSLLRFAPGADTTMLVLPCVLMSAPATPAPFTRLRMMSTAWLSAPLVILWPASGWAVRITCVPPRRSSPSLGVCAGPRNSPRKRATSTSATMPSMRPGRGVGVAATSVLVLPGAARFSPRRPSSDAARQAPVAVPSVCSPGSSSSIVGSGGVCTRPIAALM